MQVSQKLINAAKEAVKDNKIEKRELKNILTEALSDGVLDQSERIFIANLDKQNVKNALLNRKNFDPNEVNFDSADKKLRMSNGKDIEINETIPFQNNKSEPFRLIKSANLNPDDKNVKAGFSKDLPSMQLEGRKRSGSDQFRVTYPPTGKSNNKVFYFFSAFQNNKYDQEFTKFIDPSTVDEIKKLREKGYTVIVDSAGTTSDFKQAVQDNRAAGIYWRGHGAGGALFDCNGDTFSPFGDVKKLNVSDNLQFVYFGACEAGRQDAVHWKRALGVPNVVGYDYSVAKDTLKDFDDKHLSRYLDSLIK